MLRRYVNPRDRTKLHILCTENTVAVMPRTRKDVNCFVSP